jgi:uncharacterized membrane protein
MEVIWSLAFIVLFLALASLLIGSQKRKWLSFGGGIFAVISGLALIGVIFAPEDIYSELHILFAVVYYLAMALTAIFNALTIFLDKKLSEKYVIALITLVILLLIYAIIAVIGLNIPLTPEWLMIYVVGQKVIIYTLLAATCIISYGMWKLSIKKS